MPSVPLYLKTHPIEYRGSLILTWNAHTIIVIYVLQTYTWFCCIVEKSLKKQFYDLGFHVIDFWAIGLITNCYLPLFAVLHLNASI